ncbi:fructose-bisphosphate aldolase class I [Mucilaginibacter sp. UYP25]|uniref:class I fructose-bisphosphate aldolase n=1 Tax=unclassified Mucilaginibacter TaxID=2617802 RepID=UPI0033929FC9
MDIQALQKTINHWLSGDKGILAMDESTASCNKRFEALGIPQTTEMRRRYRELIVTAAGLGEYISGAILFDETIHQQANDGILFTEHLKNNGIIPGIKVDLGTMALAGFPEEKITEGLDGLSGRLSSYYDKGARFAKWRAVFAIEGNLPSGGYLYANCHLLARYAAVCQEVGLVPIVEPEVLVSGTHSLDICENITKRTLDFLFGEMLKQRVKLDAILLKPNMITAGIDHQNQPGILAVAEATVLCLLETIPAYVPGIAFLSGGQSAQLASARLNEMHIRFKNSMPWKLTYSFSRALQQPALGCWRGADENIQQAQKKLVKRAALNSAANRGVYHVSMENDD